MPHQINVHAVAGVLRLIDGKFSPHGLSPPDRLIRDLKLAPELAVARHDQSHVVAELGQGRWQGAHHIAHSTHLDHRRAFRGSEQDAHG